MRTRFLKIMALTVISAYMCTLSAAANPGDKLKQLATKKNLPAKESIDAVKFEVEKRVKHPKKIHHESSSSSSSSASNESCVCDETHKIKKLPYCIEKSGKYILDRDLCIDCTCATQCNIFQDGIIIKANDVFIEGNNHTINMRNSCGTAIEIEEYVTGVTIVNLKIANSGKPTDLQPTVSSKAADYTGLLCLPAVGPQSCEDTPPNFCCPPSGDYTFCGLSNECQLQFQCPQNPAYDMNNALIQARAILSNAYQNPFVLTDSSQCVGIGLQKGVQNLWVDNVIFDHLFIGIGAPQPVSNVLITNCVGFECGNQINNASQVAANDSYDVSNRGGLAIFSTFGCDHSNNITIKNCVAYTSVGAFGTFFANVQNVTLEDCVMAINTINTGADWAKTASVISSFFSQDILVRNCSGFGSESPFNFEGVERVTMMDCTAKFWTDTGIDFAFSRFGDFRNCNVSDSNSPAIITVYDSQKAVGFNAFLSTDIIILDSIARNLQQLPQLPFGNQSIGFQIMADRVKMKNNIADSCFNAGFVFSYVRDAMIEDNQALANGRFTPDCSTGNVPSGGAGFVFTCPACYLQPARAMFIRNVAVGNGADYKTNYVDHSKQDVFGHVINLSHHHHYDHHHHLTPYANLEKTQ